MTYLDPEIQAELNRQRIIKDMQSIRLENEAFRLENEALRGRGIVSIVLALLGTWMVARGEKLHQKNSALQTHYSELNKKTAHR